MCFAPQCHAPLNMSSSKSAPTLVCFVRFYFDMCFVPQQRTFRHLNFQRWSKHGVFCTCWLEQCALRCSGCNGVQFFIPGPATWLRARRFRKPTFRPSRATNHQRNTVNREFPTFSRTCIFFLHTFSPLWSSLFFSSPLWLFLPLLSHLSILSEV